MIMSANRHTDMDLRIGEIHVNTAGQAGKADATGADVVAEIFARAVENLRSGRAALAQETARSGKLGSSFFARYSRPPSRRPALENAEAR